MSATLSQMLKVAWRSSGASPRPTRSRQPGACSTACCAAGCRLGVGLGEAPLLRQATFSIWDDVPAMDAYARHGAHLAAIRAAAQGQHFSETLFVRFIPEGLAGDWKGRHYA